MSYLSIIFLAFALSIDACVVSFSYGLAFKHNLIINSLKLAITTGFFQGIMPVLGFSLVSLVRDYILVYADLIVFLIFTYLGIKFIEESFKEKNISESRIKKRSLFLIGVATSLDAFGGGISLSLCGNHILKPAILIGIVTFINSLIGFWSGIKLVKFATRGLEIFGGCLLLAIAVINLLK